MRDNANRFDYSWQDPDSVERFQFFRLGRPGGWASEGDAATWDLFATRMLESLSPEARAYIPTLTGVGCVTTGTATVLPAVVGGGGSGDSSGA